MRGYEGHEAKPLQLSPRAPTVAMAMAVTQDNITENGTHIEMYRIKVVLGFIPARINFLPKIKFSGN